ncbi:hypothetical protein [Pseudomonas sp. PvP028]|uniref:hypothetical protein n=1 Tax=unclassified Pseudomonas TaxID=196821 RepID=UPI001AE402AC|nr:hypothetical protein [Pseudomonas sp. PvP028]MBP1122036.1 hypothetical protein [Pseudomonas sp. PvP028]
MTELINDATDYAATLLALQGVSVSHPKLLEVVAGCLGHETFESLREEGSTDTSLHLKDAQVLVLNLHLGAARAVQCLGAAEPHLTACLAGIEHEWRRSGLREDSSASVPFDCKAGLTEGSRISVFRGVQDFYARHAREVILQRLVDEGGAEWTSDGFPELDQTIDPESEETLWSDRARWTICGNGNWIRHDHPPCAVKGVLTYRKAGRAGLVFEGFQSDFQSTSKQVALLTTFKPDVFVVDTKGWSQKRPIVAVIFDLNSNAVLASAISVSDDCSEVMEKAIKEAFIEAGTSKSLDMIRHGNPNRYVLEADHKFDSARIQELVGNLGISYKSLSKSKRYVGGIAERMFRRLNGYAPMIPPSPGRHMPGAVYTLEDLSLLITLQIKRYHETR